MWQPGYSCRGKRDTCQVLAHSMSGSILVLFNPTTGAEARVTNLLEIGTSAPELSCSVLHTGVDYWSSKASSAAQQLAFPQPVFYTSAGSVRAYVPHNGDSYESPALGKHLHDRPTLSIRSIIHSVKQDMLVVFFRSAGEQAGSTATFSAIHAAGFGVEGGQIKWMLPGMCGAFTGSAEQYYAVLSQDGKEVTVYPSSTPPQQPSGSGRRAAGPQSVKRVALFGSPATAIFAGPGWLAPRSESVEESSLERPRMGYLVWSTAEAVIMAEMESSHKLGTIRNRNQAGISSDHMLALQPRETVVQIAWQDLIAAAGEGSVLDDTGHGKASTVGAVLTSLRLLLVTATLQILVALPFGVFEAPAISMLWAGPALLFTNKNQQVKQLSWDGNVVLLCSLAGRSAASLVGAMPDRLLLLRSDGLSARYNAILEPLLHGWASLAALGVLPGGLWRAQSEMGKLMRLYDSSTISTSLLDMLMKSGCADVALALAWIGPDQQSSKLQQAAIKAAAGQWQDAVSAVIGAHKQTIYFPRSPPAGSALWMRLVALGQKALAYGQVAAVKQCWEAAGHWPQLLPLCALQGNFDSIRASLTNATEEAAAMGEQLLEHSEVAFNRNLAVGASVLTEEWRVAPEVSNRPLVAVAAEISQQLPSTRAGMGVCSTSGQGTSSTISPLDPSALQAYTGMGTSHSWKEAALDRTPLSGAETPLSSDVVQATEGRESDGGSEAATDRKGDSSAGRPDSVAQSQARESILSDTLNVPAGDSSDSDDDRSETSSVPSRPQFKVVIRDKGQHIIESDSTALKNAAGSLRLSSNLYPSLVTGPSRLHVQSAGQAHKSNTLTDAFIASDRAPLPEDLFSSNNDGSTGAVEAGPKVMGAASLAPQTDAVDQRAAKLSDDTRQTGNPEKAFQHGVACLQEGAWLEASQAFSKSLHLSQSPADLSRAAEYLTAARLLDAQGLQVAHSDKAPMLARFGAALDLADKHKVALVQSSIQLNMEAGNYKYAADRLMWLITQSVNRASPGLLRKMQDLLAQCEQKGSHDDCIPKDEDTSSFAEIAATATSSAEVDKCIDLLLRA